LGTENQMKGCAMELRVSDLQMNALISLACDAVKPWRGMQCFFVV